MPRRLALPLIGLAVFLVVLLSSGLPARADSGEPVVSLPAVAYAVDGGPAGVLSAQHPAQPSTVSSCEDLVVPGRELVWEERELEPKGARGSPYLCLLYYPEDDILWAVIVGFEGVEHFRAAKESGIRRLETAGFDLCRVGTWGAYGRLTRTERLFPDDYMNLPVECAPRVVSADPGAEGRVEAVRSALSRSLELTAEQMGWRPNRALTVIVITDITVAVRVYQRHVRGAAVAQIARDGRSVSVRVSIFGGLILANLSRAADPAAIDAFLMHEYTHFAQGGIAGSNDYLPKWFIEGQAVFQESRNTTSDSATYLRRIAQRAQREGTVLRLAEISTPEDWNAQERRGQVGIDAAYSRGYAAFAFLEKRHGFDATVQLMRDNHNGSIERFNELLAELTGYELAALDEVLGTWLLTGELPPLSLPSPVAGRPTTSVPQPPLVAPAPGPVSTRFLATDAAGYLRIELVTNAEGTGAQGTVRIEKPIPCSSTRTVATGQGAFAVMFQPNGSFSLVIPFSGSTASMVLDGRFFGPGELRGTARITFTDAACDTGLIGFLGRPV